MVSVWFPLSITTYHAFLSMCKSEKAELHKFQTLCWSDIPERFPDKT